MASINGKRVVFTGELESMTRAEAQAKAKALGATVASTVNAETDLLVAGPGAGSKLAAALKHGVKVLNEKQWLKIAGGGGKAAPAKVTKASAKKAAKKTAGKKTAKSAATKSPKTKATQSAGKKAAAKAASNTTAKATAAATAADARSLWKLLSEPNLASINQGLELAAALPGEIDGLLKDCSVLKDGSIKQSKRFRSDDDESQEFLNLALLGLLSLAPDRSAAAKLRKSVKKIDLQVADVPRLVGFTTLESLELRSYVDEPSGAPRARDLSRFGPMPKLKAIRLSLLWLRSLEGLDAPRLKEASCTSYDALTDVGPLLGLKTLTSLDLSGCSQLRSLTLTDLPALASLNLYGCRALTNLGPLLGLDSLGSLDLSGCSELRSLTLTDLPALSSLDLRACKKLRNLGPLSGLKALTSLDMSSCEKLTDLGSLSGLESLTSLNLSQCTKLTDLGPLCGLTALTSLELSGCTMLSDLTPLSNLKSLTSLDVAGCEKLTDLGPLSGLTSLSHLNLGGCEELTDLAPLSGLDSLASLRLYWCKALTDLGPLSGLTALDSLDASEVDSLAWVDPSWTGATLRKQLQRRTPSRPTRQFIVKVHGDAVAVRICRISETAYDYWNSTAEQCELWGHMNGDPVPDGACIGDDCWETWGEDDLGSGTGVLMGSGEIVVTDGDSNETVFQCVLSPKALRKQGVRANAIEVNVFKLDSSCGAGHVFSGEERASCADDLMDGFAANASSEPFDPARLCFKTSQIGPDGIHLIRAITYDGAMVAEGVRDDEQGLGWDVAGYGVMKLPEAKSATEKSGSRAAAQSTRTKSQSSKPRAKKTSKKRSPRR